MACLTASRRTEIQAKITALETRLALAESAMDGMLSTEGVESFKFDSGEAMSWAKYYTPEKLQDLIDSIEARIEWWTGKLNGTGIVRMTLRRKGGAYGH